MNGILFAPGITHYEYPVKRKGDHKMSKDGLTDHEREIGCTISDVGPISTPATGTSPKIHNPDQFLAQDAENQFKTIFFQDGDYQGPGIIINMISMVGQIFGKGIPLYSFYIFQSGRIVNPTSYDYLDMESAIKDRNKLLLQIEAYHSRGI